MYYGKKTLFAYKRLAQSKASNAVESIAQAENADAFRPFPQRLRRFLERRNKDIPAEDGSTVDYPLYDYSMEKLRTYPGSVKEAVSSWFYMATQTDGKPKEKKSGHSGGRSNYRDVAFFRDSAEVRENIFAFASALNLNREETSQLMTVVFHRCPFYVKSPIEAIFYVCSATEKDWYINGKAIYERIASLLSGDADPKAYLEQHFGLSEDDIEALKLTPVVVDGRKEYTTRTVKARLTDIEDKLEAFLIINGPELFDEENKFLEARRTVKDLSAATWRNYTLLSNGELLVFYHFYKSAVGTKKKEIDWIKSGESFIDSLGPTMYLSRRELKHAVDFINRQIECKDSDRKSVEAFISNVKTFRSSGVEKLQRILKESTCGKVYQLFLEYLNTDLDKLCTMDNASFRSFSKNFKDSGVFFVKAASAQQCSMLSKDLDSTCSAGIEWQKLRDRIYRYSKIPPNCLDTLAGMPKPERDRTLNSLFTTRTMQQSRAELIADGYRELLRAVRTGQRNLPDRVFSGLDTETLKTMDDIQFESFISHIGGSLLAIAQAGLSYEGESLDKAGWFRAAALKDENRFKALLMQNPGLFSSYSFRANQDDTEEIDKTIQQMLRPLRKTRLSKGGHGDSSKGTINNKLLLSSIVGVDQRAKDFNPISKSNFLPKWFTYSFPSERFLGLAINYRPSRGNSLTASALRRLIVLLSFFVFFSEESEPFSDGNKQAKAFLTYLNQNLLRAGLDIAYLDPFCNLFVEFSGKDYPIQFFHSFIREAVKRE